MRRGNPAHMYADSTQGLACALQLWDVACALQLSTQHEGKAVLLVHKQALRKGRRCGRDRGLRHAAAAAVEAAVRAPEREAAGTAASVGSAPTDVVYDAVVVGGGVGGLSVATQLVAKGASVLVLEKCGPHIHDSVCTVLHGCIRSQQDTIFCSQIIQ